MSGASVQLLTNEGGRLRDVGADDCLFDLDLDFSRQDLLYLGLAGYLVTNRGALDKIPREFLLAAPLLVKFLGGDDDPVVGIDVCVDVEDILILGLAFAALQWSQSGRAARDEE